MLIGFSPLQCKTLPAEKQQKTITVFQGANQRNWIRLEGVGQHKAIEVGKITNATCALGQ